MSTNASNQPKLDAVGMGVLGGAPAPSATSAAADNQVARIVSASSSVVSANSLSSAKSSIKGIIRNATFGAQEEKKEADEDRASTVSKSSASSSENGSSSVGGGNQLLMGMTAPPHPVAEFLFQLTKMLTDNNGRYIEWKSASIFVHDPPGLEKDILPKYFRHSNYSSFQRQMNYFGFRKIAGKGKMAPCSYVNEAATEDISSLLFIKRKKTGVSQAAAKLMAQTHNRFRDVSGPGVGSSAPAPLPTGLNNLSAMGCLQGVSGGGAATSLLNDQNSMYRDPQSSVLAQLQQAHASALSASQMPPAGGLGAGSAGGLSQSASKLNLALLTNDQGGIYNTGTNDLSGYSGYQDAAAQTLLNNLAGYPQGLSQASAGASDSFARIDSAANLRALLNQQISMFSGSVPSGDAYSSAMGSLAAQPLPGAMAPEPAAAPQAAGLPTEWNELFQRIGNVSTAESQSSAALRQLEQQLLQAQQQGAGAPSPSQSFNLNGLFGAGGGAPGF